MTNEQLDEIEKLAEEDMTDPWSEGEGVYRQALREYALPLVKAVREARAEMKERQETLEQSVAERASALAERNWANERYHEARAEVERLREVVRRVHGLAVKAVGEYWTVGIAAQTFREIHQLTKGEG